jgi:undecaprenyl-diphosphatase
MASPDWLQPILEWLNTNPAWTGVIIFIVAMAESLLLVGVLVPGALMMLAFGALIAIGAIELWSTLLWAIGGAVVGDGISFWIGHYFKDRLRTLWPFNKHPQMLARGETFFIRHGGKSIVLGRFVGPVRAVIPTVAGIMGMSPRRFTIINILSAIAWAPTYILPGVAVGASLGLASQVATRFGLLVFSFFVLLILVGWAIKRIYRVLQPHATQIINKLTTWAGDHPVLGRYVAPLIDPNQPEVASLAVFATLLLSCSWLFSALFVNAYTSSFIINIDETIYSLFQNLRTPWMDSIMIRFSQLGDANVTIPTTIVITLYLAFRNNYKTAAYWVAALMFAFISTLALKTLLGIPRPSPIYDGLSMFAFPSGHATVNMVMYGFLAVISAHMLQAQYRWLPFTLAGVIICSIALSRIYLGAHWASDVIGGLSLGLLWVTLLGTAYRRHCEPLKRLGGFITVLGGILFISGLMHIMVNQERETQRYTPVLPHHVINTETWWQSEWKTLPAYRIDIKKQHSLQPLTLQWAGEISHIRNTLTAEGWTQAPSFSLASALLWLTPDAKLDTLPVLPQAHNGRHETLIMKKFLPDESRLFAIRLWLSHYNVPSGEPIFIGNIAELGLEHNALFSYLSPIEDYQTPLQWLPAHLQEWQIQRVLGDNEHITLLIKPHQL